eukprot:scaffold30908_cov90-Isochrysis_galbana.AAC.1
MAKRPQHGAYPAPVMFRVPTDHADIAGSEQAFHLLPGGRRNSLAATVLRPTFGTAAVGPSNPFTANSQDGGLALLALRQRMEIGRPPFRMQVDPEFAFGVVGDTGILLLMQPVERPTSHLGVRIGG